MHTEAQTFKMVGVLNLSLSRQRILKVYLHISTSDLCFVLKCGYYPLRSPLGSGCGVGWGAVGGRWGPHQSALGEGLLGKKSNILSWASAGRRGVPCP